jgi:hypothetical protein
MGRIWGSYGDEYEDGSETLVNLYHSTRRYNPEDSHLSKWALLTKGAVTDMGFF